MAAYSFLVEDDVNVCTTNKSTEDKKTKLKIALIGETGSGKTSFIRAIQRLHYCESESDSEGEGEETIEAERYLHPGNPNVTFWDHPGLDTLKFCDPESYFKTFYLERFNAFLLFIKANPTKTDHDLAKELVSRNKLFLLIRTKIDNDLAHCRSNEKKRGILEKVKQSSLKFLADLGVVDAEEKLFLVSNFDPKKWDFDRLRTANFHDLLQSGVNVASPSEITVQQTNEVINAIDKKSLLREIKKKMGDFIFEVKASGLEAARKKMETTLEKWKDLEIKLAIIGHSGVGKSSFINVLRGVKNDDPKAAATGVVETTTCLTEYHHPDNPKITLCDLPGIGSKGIPDLKSFYKKFNLKCFDEFVIITASRFSALEVELTKRLKSINKPFLFVRTKIDVDDSNEKKLKGYSETKMLNTIRESFSKTLGHEEVFLVSNNHPRKWDFPRLFQAILNKLSMDKKVCFVFSIYIVSESILKEKVNALRGRIYTITLVSVLKKLGGKEKSRKYDESVIKKNVEHFKFQFGLPDKDSEEFKVMSPKLQEEVRMFDGIEEMGVDAWLKMFVTVEDDEGISLGDYEMEDLKKKLEIPTEAEDGVRPFFFVYNALSFVLHKMSEVASKVLHEKMDQELSFKYN